MKFKLFLLIIFLSTVFSSAHVLADVGNLSNEQMKQLMAENVPLIDIRRPEEWNSTGVIGDSRLITFFDSRGNFNLEKWLAELDKVAGKNDKFILICRSGNRTGQVAQYLDKKLGYKQVYHLKNGIKKWIKADGKVVSAR